MKKCKLAEEKEARRRGFNTSDAKDNKASKDNGRDQDESLDSQVGTVIILPKIVREFSQGRVSPETHDFLLQVLASYYTDQLHHIYQ